MGQQPDLSLRLWWDLLASSPTAKSKNEPPQRNGQVWSWAWLKVPSTSTTHSTELLVENVGAASYKHSVSTGQSKSVCFFHYFINCPSTGWTGFLNVVIAVTMLSEITACRCLLSQLLASMLFRGQRKEFDGGFPVGEILHPQIPIVCSRTELNYWSLLPFKGRV